jgi:hypothetical protein
MHRFDRDGENHPRIWNLTIDPTFNARKQPAKRLSPMAAVAMSIP